MSTRPEQARQRTQRPRIHYTALALFDQSLDAEKSLAALQRESIGAETVSLLIRDRASASDRSSTPLGDVARALVASAMGPLGSWLQGLASLIVSERGTYLVAGPMGAALATVSVSTARRDQADRPLPPVDEFADDLDLFFDEEHDESDSIYQTLLLFGLNEDDASYLEARLVAGGSLVGLTTSDRRVAAQARNEFDNQGAVYLKVVVTPEEVIRVTGQRLAFLSTTRSASDIVVADAVAPLRRLCGLGSDGGAPGHLCARAVVDEAGKLVGSVEDVLADPHLDDPDGTPRVRYAVISHGGVWRFGRRYTAVPIGEVSIPHDGPLELTVGHDVLREAPRYDRAGAFSRREELGVLAYFGVRPYWLPGESPQKATAQLADLIDPPAEEPSMPGAERVD